MGREFFVAAALAGLLVGCGSTPGPKPAPPPPEGRAIPLVFYLINGPDQPNRTTDDDLVHAVGLANQVFAEAKLTFYIHGVARPTLRQLYRNDNGDERLAWSEVAADAMTLAPSMAHEPFDDSHRAHPALWLNQVAARLPSDAVTVFVTPFAGKNGKMWGSNCVSTFPQHEGRPAYDPGPGGAWSRDGSKGIYCTPVGQRGHRVDALAHELGHYIGGLPHTWDVTDDSPEDFYDLVYAPSDDGRDLRRFSGPEEAREALGELRPVDANCVSCAQGGRRVLPQTTCVTEVRLPLPGGELVLNSARDAERLRGLVFPPLPGDWRHGVNVMSYLYGGQWTPCALRLSPSQVRKLHERLRSPVGQRDRLGTVAREQWRPSQLSPPAASPEGDLRAEQAPARAPDAAP